MFLQELAASFDIIGDAPHIGARGGDQVIRRTNATTLVTIRLVSFCPSRARGSSAAWLIAKILPLVRADGSEARDLGVNGVWACCSADEQWLYFSAFENDVFQIKKIPTTGGQVVHVRDDNAIGCQTAAEGGTLYYAKVLTQATGAWDFELRRAESEGGPSTVIGRVAGMHVPISSVYFQAFLSPDGRWLAMPLLDGSTTNVWALSTDGGQWRKLLDFGERNVMIARRIAWSASGQHVYASVSDVDADIVMLAGLMQ